MAVELYLNYSKQKTKISSALQTNATAILNNTNRYRHEKKTIQFFCKGKRNQLYNSILKGPMFAHPFARP